MYCKFNVSERQVEREREIDMEEKDRVRNKERRGGEREGGREERERERERERSLSTVHLPSVIDSLWSRSSYSLVGVDLTTLNLSQIRA